MKTEPAKTFQCAMCKRERPMGRTEEEALAEARRKWPGVPAEEFSRICADCYEKFNREFEHRCKNN